MGAGEIIAEADLVVIGAGIVGLAHALEAAERGLAVVVLDREPRATGASIRNFGHAIVSGMASGRPLEVALAARERWLRLGRDAGVPVSACGTLALARHPDELAVLEEAAAEAERGMRLVTASEAGELAPVPIEDLAGAAHATLDLRVDPRVAVARLAAWLDRRGVRFLWSTAAQVVEPPLVQTPRGRIRAPRMIVCPGPDVATLFPDAFAARDELQHCRLQMLRIAAPLGRRYEPALVTGLSLVRYPGFAAQPSAAALRDRLERERPEMLADGIHLIVTQRPDGDLIVGDTHDYGHGDSPFRDERLDELVLAEARAILGAERLDVRERWKGVYPVAPGDPFFVAAPHAGVRIVSIVSGIGMTTALGLAPTVLDDLLAGAARAA